jgi:A/G-specific adenine glycosylase
VLEFCVSRGAGARKQQKPRIKATLSYSLAMRDGSVLLQQRAATESLMPGMWELPLVKRPSSKKKPVLEVRHSITVTDYRIVVYPAPQSRGESGTWVPLASVQRLALTGLTRKILRTLGVAFVSGEPSRRRSSR